MIDARAVTDEPMDWDRLLVRLLHETQLHIIEAMWRIDRPMSASQLVQILDGSVNLSLVSYHVRRLRQLGVVRCSWIKEVRGARERFYRLATADE